MWGAHEGETGACSSFSCHFLFTLNPSWQQGKRYLLQKLRNETMNVTGNALFYVIGRLTSGRWALRSEVGDRGSCWTGGSRDACPGDCRWRRLWWQLTLLQHSLHWRRGTGVCGCLLLEKRDESCFSCP